MQNRHTTPRFAELSGQLLISRVQCRQLYLHASPLFCRQPPLSSLKSRLHSFTQAYQVDWLSGTLFCPRSASRLALLLGSSRRISRVPTVLCSALPSFEIEKGARERENKSRRAFARCYWPYDALLRGRRRAVLQQLDR